MQHATTIRSPGAIAAGITFAAVTGYVLFEDVVRGGAATSAHVLAGATLLATILAGHWCLPALKAGRVLVATGLAMIFAAGTAYVVTSSGARNAETMAAKSAGIHAVNEARAREQRQLARAEAMLAEATARLARECGSGKGTRCDGVKATVDVYTAAIKGHTAEIKALGPEKPENGGYAHAARVLAALPGVSADAGDIEQRLVLLMPFALVVICELGTLTFLALGLGGASAAASGADRLRIAGPAPSAGGADQVIEWVRAYRARHGRDPQIPEVQSQFRAMKLAKTTAWRRIKAA